MMFKSFILICLVVLMCIISGTSSVSIYRDTDVIKKSQRGGRQLNDLLDEDEYHPISPYRESRWESAEWPQPEELNRRGGGYNSDESEERPYNWFYYNKYINNGHFNHLYNGPQVDENAGMGDQNAAGNNTPKILPRPPAPSFGRHIAPKKWHE